MEILKMIGGEATKSASISKGVGSLLIYCSKGFQALTSERIKLEIERSGGSNVQITQGFVNLKTFIAAATYGSDAVTSYIYGGTTWKLSAVCELSKDGAVDLKNNDRLVITFDNVPADTLLMVDGYEEPEDSHELYTYESKIVPADQAIFDVDVANYDTIVLTHNNEDITGIDLVFENGKVCQHQLRELHVMAQDIDPIAYVDEAGKAWSNIAGLLQFPGQGLKTLVIRKNPGSSVGVFMRHDVELKALNYI